ncbi:MAG TPA: hypothetical protein PK830_07515 [Candidatus Atribacteria bacterium]|nr:hypothetical protein [Candidatus Atribacteria bacterium]HPT78933.1 hypothetical protein [Candidatus Atribacteria bacterium]
MQIKTKTKVRLTYRNLEERPVDPTQFNDPMALETEWTPLSTGASNFATHKLKRVSAERLEYRPAAPTIALFLIFPIAGILLLLYTFLKEMSSLGLILGLAFTVGGLLLLYYQTAPYVFDKQEGLYYKGRNAKDKQPDIENPKKTVPLDSIYAVQILEKVVYSNNSYYAYDINLVLKNKKRMLFISHTKKDRIKEDAREIADFLGVPVWDPLV